MSWATGPRTALFPQATDLDVLSASIGFDPWREGYMLGRLVEFLVSSCELIEFVAQRFAEHECIDHSVDQGES